VESRIGIGPLVGGESGGQIAGSSGLSGLSGLRGSSGSSGVGGVAVTGTGTGREEGGICIRVGR
jgi:hypothetical protein